ncbi:MAG: type II secretion system protein [Tepidisphaeraceae bacterium]
MKKSAFTLIELLVVISIIAILAGIALPVFGSVMEKSRATSCASNLKQLGLGVAAYLNDNDEQIFSDKDTGDKAWPKVLQNKYVTNWKVFRSPFDKRADSSGVDAPVSYGINNKVLTQTSGAGNWDGNVSKLVAPSQLILRAPAMDVLVKTVPVFKGKANEAVSLPMPGGVKLGTHNKRAAINVLFADSHVGTLPYRSAANPEDFAYITAESTGDLAGTIVKWEPIKKAAQ